MTNIEGIRKGIFPIRFSKWIVGADPYCFDFLIGILWMIALPNPFQAQSSQLYHDSSFYDPLKMQARSRGLRCPTEERYEQPRCPPFVRHLGRENKNHEIRGNKNSHATNKEGMEQISKSSLISSAISRHGILEVEKESKFAFISLTASVRASYEME